MDRACSASLGVERVNFDTRGLFAAKADNATIRVAQGKKPRVAFGATALTPEPFVRFVGDLSVERDRALLAGWAHCVAKWIAEGRRPSFFAHNPDDLHSPAVARTVSGAAARAVSVGASAARVAD